MEEIKDKINYLFSKLTSAKIDNKYVHPFFTDILQVIKYKKKIFSIDQKPLSLKTEFDNKKEILDTIFSSNEQLNKNINKIKNTYINFDENKIKLLNDYVVNGESIVEIKKLIFNISNMLIPSNIKLNSKFSLDTYYPMNEYYTIKPKEEVKELLSGKRVINIAVIGSGPIGLFIALYLNFYYNKGSLESDTIVRVIIFENRTTEYNGKIYRKPYIRERPFVTDSKYFSLLFNKIYCIEKSINYLYFNINVLEYILFSKVYVNNIPIHYGSFDYNNMNDILKQLNIEVMFDCTGGKLVNNCDLDICNPDIYKWISKDAYSNIPKSMKVKLAVEYNIDNDDVKNLITTIPLDNMVIFNKQEKFIKNYFYASLTCYNLETMEWIDKIDISIENESDLKTYIRLKNNYLYIKDLYEICKIIKDNNERIKIFQFYNKYKKQEKKYTMYFDIWHTYMRHVIECSRILNLDGHKVLYIAGGDSIFHSHWVVGSGLNRTIGFSVKCSNLLMML